MKEEKRWFGLFKKVVPEKEWEANFLLGKERNNIIVCLIYIVSFFLFTLGILAVVLDYSAEVGKCEISIDGGFVGLIKPEAKLIDNFDAFYVNELDGSIKIKGNCAKLSNLR